MYAPPKSNVRSDNKGASPALLYSPAQVGVGTFIGGPFAAIYFLKSNFDALDKGDLSRRVMIIGGIFSCVFLAALPFFPENIPNNVIPMLYLIPVMLTVRKLQPTKKEIEDYEVFGFQSSWKVFGVSLLWMLLFFAISVGVMLSLENFGVISLA